MFLYLWKTGTAWWKCIPQGVGLAIIVYVVFTVFLQIELYQGVLGQLVLKQLGA
jgi:hypothetical protein